MTVRAGEKRPSLFAALVVAGSLGAFVSTARAQDTPTPRQTCTATNVGGSAYEGLVCGGSVIDGCTAGAIYQCQGGGVQDPVDNCVLAEVCASGCLTGTTSTPPTQNTDFPQAADACFAGTRPLTVSPSETPGGTDVTVTATLSESQNTANGPILNLRGGGVLIPHPFCAVPFRLAPGPTTSPASVSFDLPTAVVDAPTVVNLDALISYTDTSGFNRALVSIPFSVRLQAGGTEPPAPAVKSATALPSIIGPGDFAVVDVELEKLAPARGIPITLSSSHPSVLSVIDNGHPFVQGACTTSAGAANVQAASVVDQETTVTISATSGAPDETPATATLTVRATKLEVSKLSMSPDSVLAGGSSTGTVTMSRPAPLGGAEVFLTSTELVVSVPTSVIVPAGEISATFTATTRADASEFVIATIRTSFDGNDFGPTGQLTVWPAGSVQAVTALSLDPTSVVGPASSTGTVTMRYAPQSEAATVVLSSSNTTVATVPSMLTVPVDATRASFTIATSEVSGSTASTITASFEGSAQSANITVKPADPPPASAVLSAYTVSPTSVAGGESATGFVTLESAAPAGGVPVDLGSQLPGTASVPASVTVPEGATGAGFTITTFPPSGTTTVQLSASLNGTTLFTSITVEEAPATPSLSAVSLSPTTVEGGASSTGTVTLTAAAPSGGFAVSLGDDSAAASAPSSVTVPGGATSAAFTVTTTSVTSTTVVTLTATADGTSRTADLTVTAAGGDGGGDGTPAFLSPAGNAPESGGDGDGFQSNAVNAYADDAAVATDTNSGSGTSTSCTNSRKDRHRFYDYGLAIPAGSAITGIEVRLDARADSTSDSPKMCVQLSWDGGASWTAAKATGTLGTSMATYTLGGASDTWGRTWSAADLANASFRLRVVNVAASKSRDFFLDWVAVRLHVAASGPAALDGLSVSPTSVTGETSSQGTVTLTSAAPAGGFAVALSSDNSAAGVPASVTVAEGATSATFAITTTAVAASTTATITATAGGVTRTAALTVNPPPETLTLTVTAKGRSGEQVRSDPAGINVSVGSTGSASFASGTSITLSVSDDRDAIWSGACSSGGNKRKTCVFTLTADAAVTADVQ